MRSWQTTASLLGLLCCSCKVSHPSSRYDLEKDVLAVQSKIVPGKYAVSIRSSFEPLASSNIPRPPTTNDRMQELCISSSRQNLTSIIGSIDKNNCTIDKADVWSDGYKFSMTCGNASRTMITTRSLVISGRDSTATIEVKSIRDSVPQYVGSSKFSIKRLGECAG